MFDLPPIVDAGLFWFECSRGYSTDNLPEVPPQNEEKIQLHPMSLAACLKCDRMETCESVVICKSCGGRRVVKAVTGPCPRGKLKFDVNCTKHGDKAF